MPFLAISCFLMYANLIAAIRGLLRSEKAHWLAHVHMLACMVASVAFLLGIELLPHAGGGINGDAYNWAPVAYLLFGAISLILFGAKLVRAVRDRTGASAGGLRFGMTTWAVLAAVYMCATPIDHFLFFRSAADSGVMDVSFSGEQMDCSGDMILVRMGHETAVYRCPKSIRLGRDYAQPFVPWPSYTEGESKTLKAAIDKVLLEATHSDDVAVQVPDEPVRPHLNKNSDSK
jgi:hypothetical protein|uniref:Uncharacterized protein n=2 Tax=Ralstonia pickettii TaxID=329 RepID=C6BPQ4_RALP1